MKKVLLVCCLLVACGKETPAPPKPSSQPAPAPPPPVAKAGQAADYDKAVAWMRSNPGYRFEAAIGDTKASGELTRAEAGKEKLRLKIGGDEWSAERKITGVAWYRNGNHDTNEPPAADRIYQWLTFFPDPQKSDVQTVGTEGDTTHIRFTMPNTKETEDVWIRSADNHLVRLKTSGAGKAFPATELTIQ